MIYIADETLERILKEDVPYLDLTTLITGIGDKRGRIRFFGREEMVLCGSEEAARIASKLQLDVLQMLPSGSRTARDQVFFEAQGSAYNLHMFWKAVMNIFEYCSGIATRTRKLVDRAVKINPRLSVVTTRKNFPGAKELSIKAVLCGGGLPHRLGLSETILIFKQHRDFAGDDERFLRLVPELKSKACEKKILAEAETLEEALCFCKAGVDGVQFDKVAAVDLQKYVDELRVINPRLVILAAGGIHEENIEEYAKTGIDAIVTTAVYFGKPADIGCRMEIDDESDGSGARG
jgi:molybdenum transport protein